MDPTAGVSAPAQPVAAGRDEVVHTLDADQLGWLELMAGRVVGSPAGGGPARFGEPGAGGPVLLVPEAVGRRAVAAGLVGLLDHEGVRLAEVVVERAEPSPAGDWWLSGELRPLVAFHHLDYPDLRLSPVALAERLPPGPVTVLWTSQPATLAVREAARSVARAGGGPLVEVVPVPAGRETDRAGHAWPRRARLETTRDPGDHLLVLSVPAVPDGADRVALGLAIAAAYGAVTVVVPPVDLPDDPAARSGLEEVARGLGVDLVAAAVDRHECGIDDDRLTALLDAGAELPEWYAEPPVAAELHRTHRPRARAGLTVFFTGLSGSGKSTVARALAAHLMATDDRSVSLLDGDAVRLHLSKGLGFARADRDTNVRRIGFVASEVTKAGGVAVCCPIAPYDATRRAVRAMVEANGGFVLVHVATPLEECERRDRKGLYAKARAGEIPEFTGISDPYETPTDAEVVVDTTDLTVDEAVAIVAARLSALGFTAVG